MTPAPGKDTNIQPGDITPESIQGDLNMTAPDLPGYSDASNTPASTPPSNMGAVSYGTAANQQPVEYQNEDGNWVYQYANGSTVYWNDAAGAWQDQPIETVTVTAQLQPGDEGYNPPLNTFSLAGVGFNTKTPTGILGGVNLYMPAINPFSSTPNANHVSGWKMAAGVGVGTAGAVAVDGGVVCAIAEPCGAIAGGAMLLAGTAVYWLALRQLQQALPILVHWLLHRLLADQLVALVQEYPPCWALKEGPSS